MELMIAICLMLLPVVYLLGRSHGYKRGFDKGCEFMDDTSEATALRILNEASEA